MILPTKLRAGYGTKDATWGMAGLQAGIWTSFGFGLNKGQYLALWQQADVTLSRDGAGGKDYSCNGLYGSNIHKGDYSQTSSECCQTIYSVQWVGASGFISVAQQLAKDYFGEKWDDVLIPYALVEM